MKYRYYSSIEFSDKQMLFHSLMFARLIEVNHGIFKELQETPRKYRNMGEVDYIKQSDAIMKTLITEYRESIYDIICDKEFCKLFPEMRQIRKLQISNMKKCIILMFRLGFDIGLIANFLYSNKQSIITIKSSLIKNAML